MQQRINGLAPRSLVAMAAVAAALSFASVATAESRTLPADLERALYVYDRATTGNDITTLATLVTDDYMLVNSDASVQGKSSYLADFAVPGFKVDPYRVEQPIHKVRGNTALTGGIMQLNWTQEGRHQSRRLRIAHFWERQRGRWRLAYTQLTRVPE